MKKIFALLIYSLPVLLYGQDYSISNITFNPMSPDTFLVVISEGEYWDLDSQIDVNFDFTKTGGPVRIWARSAPNNNIGSSGSPLYNENSGSISSHFVVRDEARIDSVVISILDTTSNSYVHQEWTYVNYLWIKEPIVSDTLFTIYENASTGDSIGAVTVDPGALSVISSYAITAGNTSNAFSINSEGAIYVNNDGVLDFESTPIYKLVVSATDTFNLTGADTVTINILDFEPPNDFCTDAITLTCGETVSGSTIDATNDISVASDCGSNPVGSGTWYHFIGNGETVSISTCDGSDYDTGIGVYTGSCIGGLNCVTGNDDGGCGLRSLVEFNSIINQDYYVMVDGFRSARGNFNLSISCAATSPPPVNDVCTDAESLTVFTAATGTATNGTNINASTFSGQLPCNIFNDASDVWYTFNSGVNTQINITNTVGTLANLNMLVYETSCDGPVLFCQRNMGNQTKLISVSPGTDYLVQVYDGSGPGTFSIIVNDGPNTAPQFETDSSGVRISWYSPEGLILDTLDAEDAEGHDISYSISSSSHPGMFAIDAQTGIITLEDPSALQAVPPFLWLYLFIQATDSGPGGLTSLAQFDIRIEDNAYPTVASSNRTINENTSNGTPITSLAASDDDGDNLIFSIVDGNTDSAFAINGSGVISVYNQSALNFEINPVFELQMQVSDDGPLELKSNATVKITLNNINDAPMLSAKSFDISIHNSNSYSIGALDFSDDDPHDTHSLEIVAGNTNSIFELDASYGELTIINESALQSNGETIYLLTVEVTDDGNPSLSGSADISINAFDNAAPVLISEELNLDENTSNSTLITIVSSVDVELDAVTISIEDGNELGAFTVDSEGNLTVEDENILNFEVISEFELLLKGTDDGPGTLAGYSTITISLNDINEAPQVDVTSFNISSLSPNGYLVGTVTATDPEGDDLTFSIISGNENNEFSINAANGEIIVLDGSLLNPVTTPTINLEVQVSDGNLTGSDFISIHVFGNDYPRLVSTIFNLNEIAANQLTLDQIGIATLESDDESGIERFEIVAGNIDDLFTLNSQTGLLTIIRDGMNYEQYQEFILVVRLTDDGIGNIQHIDTVTITLNDVNEFTPSAFPLLYDLEENAPVGTLVADLRAYDTDIFQNLAYEITGGDPGDAFVIDADGFITVNNPQYLDYESQGAFTLNVAIRDNGIPADTGNIVLNISLINVNDLSPNDVCTNAITITCGEMVAGSTVDATPDAAIAPNCGSNPIDDGSRGVWYHIVGTGETIQLSTCGDANYDTGIGIYTGSCLSGLTCVAGNDDGANCTGFTSEVDFNSVAGQDYFVLIDGFESNTGNFNLTISCSPSAPPPPNYQCVDAEALTVSTEGAGILTNGTTVDATTYTGQLNCDLYSNVTDVWYTFNSGDNTQINLAHDLGTAGPMGMAMYQLSCSGNRVSCVSNISNDTLLLNVVPNNNYYIQLYSDNVEGTFTVQVYDGPNTSAIVSNTTASISRYSPEGFIAGTVTATDAENHQQTFEISNGNDEGIFGVNPSSGEVSVEDPLALELSPTSSFSLTILSADQGPGSISSAGSLIIDIIENNYPTISDQEVIIDENSSNSSTVVTITSSDSDGDNLIFDIIGGNTNNTFAIDGSGIVTVNDESGLNFEVNPEFELEISVTDDGPLALSSTATLIVLLNDRNEAPIVTSASKTVSQFAPDGHPVGQVAFTDEDQNQNHTFAIAGGNFNTVFGIDPTSGLLTIVNAIDLEGNGPASYSLEISVTDDGNPFEVGSGTLTVNVFSNNPPVITSAQFSIDENTANLTIVGTVASLDAEADDILLYISSGNESGAFSMNTDGQIIVNDVNQLDFEMNQVFELEIEAEDDGPGALSGFGEVMIILNNVNETPEVANASFDISSFSPDGFAVGSVSATDPENDDLHYTVTVGNDNDAFNIDQSSGLITVANSSLLNPVTNPVVNLQVTVSDDEFDVIGNIQLNVYGNDFPRLVTTEFIIDENQSDGTSVGTLISDDASGIALFEILSGNVGNALALNGSTGDLTVNIAAGIDYEVNQQFELIVRLTDEGLGNLQYDETVIIFINDINEFAPQVSAPDVAVNENQPIGIIVAYVSATDGDIHQTLSYAIVDGDPNSQFSINNLGEIITEGILDHETNSNFALTIEVSDDVSPINTTSISMSIDINDINDAPSLANISNKSADVGIELIFTVIATDADEPADNITYSLDQTSVSLGMTINALSGVFRWTPLIAHANSLKTITAIASDGEVTSVTMFTITVNNAAQTVTFNPLSQMTYGDQQISLGATSSSGLQVSYTSSNENIATILANELTIVGAGSAEITAYQSGNNTYDSASTVRTLIVNKIVLVATVVNISRSYGEDNPEFLIQYSGFVLGEDSGVLDTPPVANTIAVQQSPVTSYPIVASGGSDTNYSFTYVDGRLTVNKKTLVVNIDNQSKLYGETLPDLTINYVGFTNADDASTLDIAPIVSTTADQFSLPGSYTISAIAGFDDVYEFNYLEGTLTINKAVLIATPDDTTRTYGETNPLVGISYSGFVLNETISEIDIPAVVKISAQKESPVGIYPITVSGASDTNYDITYSDAQLTITKAILKVKADDIFRFYGAVNPELTILYDGFLNGDELNVLDSLPIAATNVSSLDDAGEYEITVVGGFDDNYLYRYEHGVLTIDKTILSVTIDNKTRQYGAEDPDFTFQLIGFQNNDDLTLIDVMPTVSSNVNLSSGIGSYGITASGGSDNNYSFSVTDGELLITRAPLTVLAENQTQEYGNHPELNASYIGFLNGENNAVLGTQVDISTPATILSAVGEYAITLEGGSATNYELFYQNGSLAIIKATLTIIADNKTINEGEAIPQLTISYSGFRNGEDESVLQDPVNISTTANNQSGSGTYPIELNGGFATNYELTRNNGTLTVNTVLAIDAEVPSGIRAYPTTFQHEFYIELSSGSGETHRMELFSIDGRQVLSRQLDGNVVKHTISGVEQLEVGIYFLRIIDKEHISSFRLIKI